MKVTTLLLSFLIAQSALSPAGDKTIPYGDNADAGHYLQVGGTKIYYETYGTGPPLVLLHGGLFGYIDEFSGVIPELSRHYTVIAIALRGHGKSDLGQQPLSNALFGEDSAAVIRHVTREPVNLVGFSVGAMAAYLLTINHPELVHKLIAVGGPIDTAQPDTGPSPSNPNADPTEFEKQLPPQFITRRNTIYPDRAKWNRLVVAMGKAESQGVGVGKDEIQKIQCPTLIAAGDRDNYTPAGEFVEIYRALPHGELAIIPGCGHTVFNCNPGLMIEVIERFFGK